ncbi:MAG TPA: ABC transporter substrate-binding protein [Actinomycetota bacterium]|nr:ABC transporter substrate-binding protein [Actinomycetota bacterium]
MGLALALALVAAACGGGNNEPSTSGGQQATPQKGGVLRTAISDFGFTNGFDPTGEYVAVAIGLYGAMERTLMGYKHVAGPPGNELFPDLATAAPEISSDGLKYTFKLKSGIKWAPPLNRDVTSKDVAYAFQRINTAPLVAQYGFWYYGVVKGMDGKAKSADEPVSGIETPDDSTIIFNLEKPTGDFLYRISMPAAAPIPEEVAKCFKKAGDYGRYVMSNASYMIQGADKLDISSCSAMKPISGFDPSKSLTLVRNPNYDQATDNTRSNYVDGITVTIDTNVDDIFSRVQAGDLDSSIADQPPKPVLQQYLTDSAKKPFLHSNDGDRTWYITMNWITPPFDDLHVRKAANWVMDKAGIQQAWGGSTFGDIATHNIPPIVLGGLLPASEYNPYPSDGNHGDEAKAKEEMKQSKYDTNKDGVCDAPECSNLVMINRNTPVFADSEAVVVSSLDKIGIKVKPRELASSAAYTTIQTVKNKIPIALNAGWGKDFADAISFVLPLFDGRSIIPTGNTNYPLQGMTPDQAKNLGVSIPAGVTIPSVDADVDACQNIPATEADKRNQCFADIDKKLMETAAPWVPYLWAKNITVTGNTVTKWEFDQFSGYLSYTQMAVNNNATVPS